MIHVLSGLLRDTTKNPADDVVLIIYLNGLGFKVLTSESTLAKLPPVGEVITVHTHLHVREDALTLIGFLTEQERDLFVLLQSASGVGVKVALAILNALSVAEVAQAVVSGNHKALTVAKGVGPKLAQKIILDLKEKMKQWRATSPASLANSLAADLATLAQTMGTTGLAPAGASEADMTQLAHTMASEPVQEVESVLLSLGYTQAEVFRCLSQTLSVTLTQPKATLHPEPLLQDALRWLAQNT
jgi:Holliday junction DNA helicase RuvA